MDGVHTNVPQILNEFVVLSVRTRIDEIILIATLNQYGITLTHIDEVDFEILGIGGMTKSRGNDEKKYQ